MINKKNLRSYQAGDFVREKETRKIVVFQKHDKQEDFDPVKISALILDQLGFNINEILSMKNIKEYFLENYLRGFILKYPRAKDIIITSVHELQQLQKGVFFEKTIGASEVKKNYTDERFKENQRIGKPKKIGNHYLSDKQKARMSKGFQELLKMSPIEFSSIEKVNNH